MNGNNLVRFWNDLYFQYGHFGVNWFLHARRYASAGISCCRVPVCVCLWVCVCVLVPVCLSVTRRYFIETASRLSWSLRTGFSALFFKREIRVSAKNKDIFFLELCSKLWTYKIWRRHTDRRWVRYKQRQRSVCCLQRHRLITLDVQLCGRLGVRQRRAGSSA